LFMTLATKYVARESERSGLIRRKPYFLGGAGMDIGSQLKRRKLEPVAPVPTVDFQDHRHAFFDGDLTGLEFKSGGGEPDDLFVVRHSLRGGSNDGLLIQVADRSGHQHEHDLFHDCYPLD